MDDTTRFEVELPSEPEDSRGLRRRRRRRQSVQCTVPRGIGPFAASLNQPTSGSSTARPGCEILEIWKEDGHPGKTPAADRLKVVKIF